MKKLISIFIVLLFSAICFAQPQPPDTLWTKTYGGSNLDIGYSVQQTTDGGFIAAGYTESFSSGSDPGFYLIKTDESGNVQWEYKLGGENSPEYGGYVQQTDDGGYIIVGEGGVIGSGYQVYCIKTDSMGLEQWSNYYGGVPDDFGRSIRQTTDGGYIIAGYKETMPSSNNRDVSLIKINANGYQQWYHTFGRTITDIGECVQQTADGGYIIAGYTVSGLNNNDILLIKTDSAGELQWWQVYGNSFDDKGYSVQQTTDGGYIVCGFNRDVGFDHENVFLVKTDSLGNQQWSQIYGGNLKDFGRCVQQTNDGGYIITGYSENFTPADMNVYVIKTDSNGFEQWSKYIGEGGEGDELSYCIQQTADEGYIIAGQADSYGAGDRDVYLIRLDSEGSLVGNFGNNHPADFSVYLPYPNPFNASTIISFDLRDVCDVSLVIYDIYGREITKLETRNSHLGTNQIVWDANGQASGIYFVRLQAGEFEQIQKIVLLK